MTKKSQKELILAENIKMILLNNPNNVFVFQFKYILKVRQSRKQIAFEIYWPLKTGSDKIIYWLGRHSFLTGFIMLKKHEKLHTALLIRI